MAGFPENYGRILERMGRAALRAGRSENDVRLIGVTKRVGPERIREAIRLGLADIGENRVQEAEEKLPLIADTGVRCHLIGHLQSNKARKAIHLFTSIQTIDSVHLAGRLDAMLDSRLPVSIQVRSGNEVTKSGVSEADLPELVNAVRATRWLELEGFLTIPPPASDPETSRTWFARLSKLGEAFRVAELSMGMSHDFEVAIEEGATQVRIGTALFGERRGH